MHKLTIEDDEGKTVVVPVIRDEITVGRQEGNSIRLTEKNISRRHARIFRQSGNLMVEDLGSFIGVRVNSARISAVTALKDGDVIVVGDYKLTVKTERPLATIAYAAAASPFSRDTGAPPAAAPAPASAPAPAAAAPAPVAPAPLQSTTPLAPFDGAPTIPVRTVPEPQHAPRADAAPGAPAARLMVISTNLAGAEFSVERPSLVIGRTPENDIVLNHKSISRHHAKILREGDKYIVVDLESANGVRVNGVDFEKVELGGGDVLELGHVRLRFGHGADLDDLDVPARGSRKKLLIGGTAIGVVAIAGIVFALGAGGSSAPAEPTKVAVAAQPATPPPITAEPIAAAPATPPPAPGPASDPAPYIADAKAAMARESWPEALTSIMKAVEAAPGSAEAATLRRTIENESQDGQRFTALTLAVERQEHQAVLDGFAAISDGSVYKSRARPFKDQARSKLISRHLALAQKAQSAGRCDDARSEVDAVLALDPQNASARGVTDQCEKAAARLAEKTARAEKKDAVAAAAPPPAAPRPPRTPRLPSAAPAAARPPVTVAAAPRPAAARPPEAEPQVAADPDALIQDAQQAWLRGQYAAAIDSARKALKAKPGFVRAYQIIAVCSCSLKDADAAAKAYERLDDRMKPLVKSACQKSGIALD